MFKAIVIIFLVVGFIVGGLLALRRSGRVGMPDKDVLERASKRASEQAAADKDEEGRSAK